MLKNWMKPIILLGLLGIILYSGIVLNVFNNVHAHSHSHDDGEKAEHHHDVEEKKDTQNAENGITQPQDVQDQHESKQEHDHDGHEH